MIQCPREYDGGESELLLGSLDHLGEFAFAEPQAHTVVDVLDLARAALGP